jgi:hypothetical protein
LAITVDILFAMWTCGPIPLLVVLA